jgi:hypothetical protein
VQICILNANLHYRYFKSKQIGADQKIKKFFGPAQQQGGIIFYL